MEGKFALSRKNSASSKKKWTYCELILVVEFGSCQTPKFYCSKIIADIEYRLKIFHGASIAIDNEGWFTATRVTQPRKAVSILCVVTRSSRLSGEGSWYKLAGS